MNQVREIHDNSPFIHRFSKKNKVVYVREHSDFTDKKYFYWTNAWEPDDVFFTSLLNSGELLKIKNETLINEIESIYTKQEERISGTFAARNSLANQMIQWDLKKSIALGVIRGGKNMMGRKLIIPMEKKNINVIVAHPVFLDKENKRLNA